MATNRYSHIADAIRRQITTGILSAGDRLPAETELAAHLRVPPATPLTEYVYLGSYDAFPCSLARVYVPCDVADLGVPGEGHSPLGDDIRDRLAEAGVHVANTVSRVTARVPDSEEAWTLRIGTGTAVLAIERVSTDTSGRVVEAALLVLPGHSSETVFAAAASVGETEVAG